MMCQFNETLGMSVERTDEESMPILASMFQKESATNAARYCWTAGVKRRFM